MLQDAYAGTLKPLYNYMADLPASKGAPIPLIAASAPAHRGRRDEFRRRPRLSIPMFVLHDHQRAGAEVAPPFPDDVEKIIRENVAQGLRSFFITDDNFARNKDWEAILDRLIHLRKWRS